ncbi:DUF1772 domain-containing protein [Actinomadura barringtoniae]|uniref:DUF1772 domain-containing protein n=1 Tax=Actinomadura barringtoniae TaxID=1427535 RepID=A0A939P689_9ACTN|nr:DUF1772 domain-containing protein [Actinomadura barringtoniae]MBO2445562.1 DUF1772 domain-containing protein [Actinomadura barringtoniae]
MIRFLVALALLGTGLSAGGLSIASLGGAPLLLALPVDRYVPVHKFLVTRFDPFMPICLLTGLVTDLLLTFFGDAGDARGLFAGAAAACFAVMVVSLTKNVPINKWVEKLNPDELPADWDSVDPRERWRNWNVVRTGFAVLALVLNVIAVAILIGP